MEYLPASHGFDEYFGVPFSDDMGATPWFTPPSTFNRTPLPLLQQSRGNTSILEQPTDLSVLTARYTVEVSDSVKCEKDLMLV